MAGFSVVLAAIDLLFKAAVEEQDQSRFPRLLPHTGGRIKLQKFHNDGFPFGFWRGHVETVRMVTLAMTSAVAGALVVMMGRRGNRAEKIGLTLILGGAMSNLYDRLVRRYVVDYFSLEFGRLKQVIFNLGDMFVMLGSLFIVFAALLRDARQMLTEKQD